MKSLKNKIFWELKNGKFLSNKLWLWIGIPVAIILLAIFWYIGTYNSLIRMNEQVNNKWAQVETQYQRRVDLIPNLVNTVKGAANFEQKTLEDITNARSQWQAAVNPEQKVAAANNVESALARLLVVVENYPQLKATQNYLALQDELANTENKVAVERGRYNDAVLNFNSRIKTFPTYIVARNLGYSDRTYFQAKQGAENAPEVKF